MGLDNIVIPSYADIFFAIFVVEIIIGTFTNAFIILVNLRDWVKGQILNSSDRLVVSLALSNACFVFGNAASVVFYIYFTGLVFLDYVFYTLYGVMMYTIFSSSWLSSWLCLFFFLKLITFKGGCFGWMKVKVESLVPWLIFSSQVISFFSSLPFIWTTTKVFSSNFTSLDLGANQTLKVIGYKINDSYIFFSLIVNCFVPFLIVTATTGRIIASLTLHAQHMKQNMEDSRGASLKVHRAAARTMSSLLLIYLIFYVVEIALGFLPMDSPMYWICYVLILVFPNLQSIILITGNSKLRQVWSDLMNCKKKH
ncbi:taste receptor type 2 member 40-like [Aquarana catesbeiana]|uniref:taste receptor type 2 member 40-like n=1 Tax=Aquarana catesbeiana TaxID=8400 RepID=UPI003CCA56D5